MLTASLAHNKHEEEEVACVGEHRVRNRRERVGERCRFGQLPCATFNGMDAGDDHGDDAAREDGQGGGDAEPTELLKLTWPAKESDADCEYTGIDHETSMRNCE